MGQVPEGLRVEILWDDEYKNEQEVRAFVDRMNEETNSEVVFGKVVPNQV